VSIRRRDAWRGGLVLLTVLLTLGAGFCLFDQGAGHHEGMALDFCVLMVVVLSIAPMLLARPLLSGWVDAFLPPALTNAPVRTLDPPPTRASLLVPLTRGRLDSGPQGMTRTACSCGRRVACE